MASVLKHLPRGVSKLHKSILPIKGVGCWIYDNNSEKYLDLTSGIGALSTGHSHPIITEAIKNNIDKIVHAPQQIFMSHKPQIELTHKLLDIMPNKNLDNIFYVNSGSEATDNAIKIARSHTGKHNIIGMSRGFHGRTLGALSITSSNNIYKSKIQSLVPGMFFCHDFTIESLMNILEYNTSPQDTAAIILEPVLGEGGIFSIPKKFLKDVNTIAKENNILIIADEVQCGSGRTGTWWNVEQKEIEPDLLTFGKGIASGFPLAAIASTSEIMNTLEQGVLGGTYGGNIMATIAASHTIDIINDENLLENTNMMGHLLKSELEQLNKIKEVRQYGLMIGIEFADGIHVPKIVDRLRSLNVLVLMAGNKQQYLRILPPMIINSFECYFFLERLEKVLSEY